MSKFSYIGKELEIFSHAVQWKNYYHNILSPFLKGYVLEVGAGIGATTAILCNNKFQKWICLEPDLDLINIIDQRIIDQELPSICETRLGTVGSLDSTDVFDAILYIDVLEHIENDAVELSFAATHLKPGGILAVLSPAHNWLFTPFDKKIGHYRRYSKKSLSKITPKNCRIDKILYLDSAGMFLSLANKLLLRQSMPTIKQILFWDRKIIPFSKKLDSLLSYSIGKSILCLWKRTDI